jgi:hypothetical protein
MPTYYLVRDIDNHHWPLGETSFKKFYAEDGWIILECLVKNNEKELLETMHIRRDDTPNKMTIEEFLDEAKKYQILLDND